MTQQLQEFSEPTSNSPSADEIPLLGPEHQRLEAFIGRWKVGGQGGESASNSPNALASGVNDYQLMPGGFFLLQRGAMRFGEHSVESVQLIGFDQGRRRYRMNLFDNAGYARLYEGESHGDTWHFAGAHERVTFTFMHSGATMKIHWEQLDNDSTWKSLCQLEATKIQ